MFSRSLKTALIASLLAGPAVFAQEAEILEWTWDAEAAQPAATGQQQEYRLSFRAKIAEGYIIYGSDFDADMGPRPTRVRFETPQASAGALQSLDARRKTDKVFNIEYSYFDGEARLQQTVQVPAGTQVLSGTIRGQTCYEKDGTCALFSRKFEIALPSAQR